MMNMSAGARLGVLRRHFGAVTDTFRAAECHELGKPLTVVVQQRTPLNNDEIRIKTKACGLNWATYLTTKGLYQIKLQPPFVPGNEIAGQVIAIGSDVRGVSPGDDVIAVLEGTGGLQEEIVLPHSLLEDGVLRKLTVKRRDDIEYAKVVALLVNYGTAWMALTRKALVKAGDTVLVTGASGGVGLAAVELASKIFNCQTIGICKAEKSHQVLKTGAHHVIDYQSQDVRKELKKICPEGINVVIDTAGGEMAVDLVKSLAFEGRLITIGYTAGIPKIPANLLLLKSAAVIGLWWGSTRQLNPAAFNESLDAVLSLYQAGKLDPYVQAIYPLDEINTAFEEMAARRVTGKLVISLS